MRSMVLFFAAIVTLGGCSTFRGPEPPICDGRHRRPANPYGSVLDAAPAPADTPAPSEASPPDGGCA